MLFSSCPIWAKAWSKRKSSRGTCRPGEQVRVDQPLVDVMTDKATVTIPSGFVGRIVRTIGDVGETVAVGGGAGELRYFVGRLPRSNTRDPNETLKATC